MIGAIAGDIIGSGYEHHNITVTIVTGRKSRHQRINGITHEILTIPLLAVEGTVLALKSREPCSHFP